MRLVIYEIHINNMNKEDELNLFDCESLKEAQYFFKNKLKVDTSLTNLSKHIRDKGLISKRYKIYKIK